MHWTVSLVLCQSLLWTTMAYPTGAPSSACSSMVPSHYGTNPQTGESPFFVNVSATIYRPGDEIQVTISEPCQVSGVKTFKGFLIQARRADENADRDTPLGTFTPVVRTKTLNCGSDDMTLTHDSRVEKTGLTFNWRAPAQPVGHVVFRATIVQDFQTYWVKVYSPVIRDASVNDTVKPGDEVYPEPRNCLTTETKATATTTATTKEAYSTTRMMKTTTKRIMTSAFVDESCGVTKGCFSDCNVGTCTFLITWNYTSETKEILFEVTTNADAGSNQWLAIGFSNDMSMGDDSVVECVFAQGEVRVYSSFNTGHHNYRITGVDTGVRKISGSLMNGIMKCSFGRAVYTQHISSDLFNLDKMRHLLAARGYLQGSSNEKAQHHVWPVSTPMKVDLTSRKFYKPLPIASGSSPLGYGAVHGAVTLFMWTFSAFYP